MEERRYNDEEIREIFRSAADPQISERQPALAREGLSLSELKAVAQEVGLSPDRVARAAANLDSSGELAPRGTQLGFPTSVGRSVELPRQLTDREWSILLSDLRETFSARGRDRSEGETRVWRNGNLHAYVEPTRDGYRLRMGTRKRDAVAAGTAGIVMLIVGLVLLINAFVGGSWAGELLPGIVLSAVGTSLASTRLLSIGRWAAQREEQMGYIAERAIALVTDGKDGDPVDTSPI